jgi:hypothetical protein
MVRAKPAEVGHILPGLTWRQPPAVPSNHWHSVFKMQVLAYKLVPCVQAKNIQDTKAERGQLAAGIPPKPLPGRPLHPTVSHHNISNGRAIHDVPSCITALVDTSRQCLSQHMVHCRLQLCQHRCNATSTAEPRVPSCQGSTVSAAAQYFHTAVSTQPAGASGQANFTQAPVCSAHGPG